MFRLGSGMSNHLVLTDLNIFSSQEARCLGDEHSSAHPFSPMSLHLCFLCASLDSRPEGLDSKTPLFFTHLFFFSDIDHIQFSLSIEVFACEQGRKKSEWKSTKLK